MTDDFSKAFEEYRKVRHLTSSIWDDWYAGWQACAERVYVEELLWSARALLVQEGPDIHGTDVMSVLTRFKLAAKNLKRTSETEALVTAVKALVGSRLWNKAEVSVARTMAIVEVRRAFPLGRKIQLNQVEEAIQVLGENEK